MRDITLENQSEITEQRPPWAGLWALAGGLAMIVLDGTIVSVAMPDIIASLNMDLTDAQWVSALYNIVFAGLLLPLGRLGDLTRRRTLFLSGVAVFIIGSCVAGFAPTTAWLLASRALQGIGGAMVLPSTLSTVSSAFRGKNRAVAFGIWGAVMSGAAALGPLLGGWLTSAFDWRWIFFVNIPIGLLVILAAWRTVPETAVTQGEEKVGSLDYGGAVLSALAAALLVFGLIEGHSLGWWKSTDTTLKIGSWKWPFTAISPAPCCIILGALLAVLFVAVEIVRKRNGKHVMLDTTMFRIPTFSWGNATAGLVAAGEFALVFVLPLYLVNAVGLSIMQSGIILAAMALGAFMSGAMARHLSARIGASNVVILGLVLEVIGVFGTQMVMNITISSVWLALMLMIYGVGLGLASAQLTSVVLADVPVENSGVASATQSTVRQLGSALGAAIAGTALSMSMTMSLPTYLADINGLPQQQIDGIAQAAQSSAGNAIAGFRDQALHMTGSDPRSQAMHTQLQHIVEQLSQGFAQASRVTLLVACVMLVLGFIGALMVRHYSKREQA